MKELTTDEIRSAVDADKYPAILNAAQAAELLGIAKSTLYRRVSEGAFRSCVRRGKPLLFWRDRLIQAAFSTRW